MIWSTLIGDYKPINFVTYWVHMTKSRQLRGKALIEYKSLLKLNHRQKEVLIGTLLGDASMVLKLGKPTYQVKFEQSIQRKEYIEYLYGIFEDFVGTPPKIRDIRGGGAKPRQSIWFRTYSHSAFKFYDDIFYIRNKTTNARQKCVPAKIQQYLTPRALAFWFMDDGTLSNQDYIFSTQSFVLSDQKRLQKALKKAFGLQINIHKDGNKYRLYVCRNSETRLRQLIGEFIHPKFKSKLKA